MRESSAYGDFYGSAAGLAQKSTKFSANAQNGRQFGEASSEGVQDALKGKKKAQDGTSVCKTLA